MKLNYREWERDAQVMLFVICTFDELKKVGLVEGGTYQTTPQGVETVNEMKLDAESGLWELPTRAEIDRIITFLHREALREKAKLT